MTVASFSGDYSIIPRIPRMRICDMQSRNQWHRVEVGILAKAARAFSKLAAVPPARRPRCITGRTHNASPNYSASLGTPAPSPMVPTRTSPT